MKHRALFATVVILVLVLPPSAFSAQLNFTPVLTLSEEYNDNIFLTNNNEEDDYITRVSLGGTLELLGRTVGAEITYLPAYEWYNDSISIWTNELGQQLVNYTPGTRSNADYTTPDMGARYVDSETIMQSIFQYEKKDPHGLNGFILLLHVGTDPQRTDKFYFRLPEMLDRLQGLGYQFLSFKNVY